MEGTGRGIAGLQLHTDEARHTINDPGGKHLAESIMRGDHPGPTAARDQNRIRGPPKLLDDAVSEGTLRGDAVRIWAATLEPFAALDHFPTDPAGGGHVAVDADHAPAVDEAFKNFRCGNVLLHEDHGIQPGPGTVGGYAGRVVAGRGQAHGLTAEFQCFEHAQGRTAILQRQGRPLFHFEIEIRNTKFFTIAVRRQQRRFSFTEAHAINEGLVGNRQDGPPLTEE